MPDVHSMTGYGRGWVETEDLRLKIEIRSLNNRYLDINFRMPKLLFALEEKMRSAVSMSMDRGKVDLYIDLRLFGTQESRLRVNEALLSQYLQVFEELHQKGSLASRPSPTTLASLPEVFVLEEMSDPTVLEEPLLLGLENALKDLKKMRSAEGNYLCGEILKMAEELKARLEQIRDLAPEILRIYRAAMEERIKEFLARDDLLSEERLEVELAIYAERKDITEELSRIESHLAQLDATLRTGGTVGRKLDFLAQELGREINTIGSKSSGYPITHQVIEMKSLLEQIREQVQNLE